jgi:N utilization substance protein A
MDIDLRVLRTIESDRGIAFTELVAIIEAAILAAYYRSEDIHLKRDEVDFTRAVLDDKTGEVKIYTRDKDEANAPVGEERDVTPENFGRIAASSAKQVIMQRLRAINDENLLGEFSGKVGDVVIGTIQQGPRAYMIHVDLGSLEALLPPEEQVVGEDYTHGKRIRVIITKVDKGTRGGAMITVSRRHKMLVRKLFALEVPEIASGQVEIMQVAREAGHRTKIAVKSTVAGLNAKGACIGPLGARVRAVSAELNDEKIDIVDYDEDIKKFVAAALSPAKISATFTIPSKDPDGRVHVRALVPDYQLSLAIGKEGQNAKLAADLTGAKIDIQPESILEDD